MIAAGCWLLGEAAVTFFGQETLARWEAPVPRSLSGAPYLPGNPYLLWEMVPGERVELGVTVTVNSSGLRGPEIDPVKPEGTRRVVVVGDSTVYGHGVSGAGTFAQKLQGSLGSGFEVINAGVPGYSTEQTLNLLDMRIWDMSPDLIIIASMWSDNNFDSFVDAELICEHRAFEGRWTTPLTRVAEHSAIYRFADWHLRIAHREAAVRQVGWMLGRAPQGDRRRVPVNDYAANLQRIVSQADIRGAQVAFLGLANHVDMGAATPGAQAWVLYRQVMADTASRNQAPLIDVSEAFEASGLGREVLFLDEMHPTEQGHGLIAQALAAALQPWADGGVLSHASSDPVQTYEDPYTRGSLGAGPAGEDSAGTAEILGMVLTAQDTPLQIDALVVDDKSGDTLQVAGERLDGPGAFSLRVPAERPIMLRVYRDSAGDGPGPGDPLISFSDQPITASQSTPTQVRLSLDDQTLSIQ